MPMETKPFNHKNNPDEVARRLSQWQNDSSLESDLEAWYQDEWSNEQNNLPASDTFKKILWPTAVLLIVIIALSAASKLF